MIYKAADIVNERKDKVRGGAGFMMTKALVSIDELCSKGRLFNLCVLEPGSAIGVHKHEGEVEAYYFIKGEGTYNDNGTNITVSAGDVTYCKDGESHGIANTGKENLEFIALILFSQFCIKAMSTWRTWLCIDGNNKLTYCN